MRDSMWALTYDRKTDPWDKSTGMRRTEVQRPTLDEAKSYTDGGMVLIRTRYAGFCGSDRGIWFRRAFGEMISEGLDKDHKDKRVMGHELLGEVVAVGSMASREFGYQPGDIVSTESHIVCGTCYQCRTGDNHVCADNLIIGISTDGCFAEYVKLPARALWRTDTRRIRPEVAALQEPFGNAVHACTKVNLRGKRIAIIGCGTIGLFAVAVAKALGARLVIGVEPMPSHAEKARALGCDHVLTPKNLEKDGYAHDPELAREVRDLTDGVGVDVALEMSGQPSSVNNAIACVRRGGDVILFGLKSGDQIIEGFDRVIVDGISLHSVVGRRIFETWHITKSLLENRDPNIHDKIWDIILEKGKGTVTEFTDFDAGKFETSIRTYPKVVLHFPGLRPSMYGRAKEVYGRALAEIREAGLEKKERLITSPQGASITTKERPGPVLNFCANNYLGLSSHPKVLEASKAAIDRYGFGLSSVRFICGTQDAHKTLEAKVSTFLGTEDTILYSSCFDANGGLFETLLGEEDAIISDALNHASIIDGIRLCKAERHRYANGDMGGFEAALQATQGKRLRMVATDGVFSMDGFVAKLETICALAEKYEALVMVDDSHATGFVGKTGRGTPEHCGVMGRVDVITSTLGKALGGAAGGFTSGRKEIVDLLRQRSRPYLFSNTLAPAIVGASIAVLDLIGATTELRDKLMENARLLREAMTKAGFTLKEGFHPIVPVMLGDAKLAADMASALLEEGIYVIGFSYPVVPKGAARIRVQLSAAHEPGQVTAAAAAFQKVGRKLGVVH